MQAKNKKRPSWPLQIRARMTVMLFTTLSTYSEMIEENRKEWANALPELSSASEAINQCFQTLIITFLSWLFLMGLLDLVLILMSQFGNIGMLQSHRLFD